MAGLMSHRRVREQLLRQKKSSVHVSNSSATKFYVQATAKVPFGLALQNRLELTAIGTVYAINWQLYDVRPKILNFLNQNQCLTGYLI